MIRINSQEMKKAFSDNTKTQVTEQVNIVDNSKVIPIVDVTPWNNKICDIIKFGVATNSTSTTIYTTPTNQDFYLVSATLSTIKDATSTSTNSGLNVVINGANSALLSISSLTLTAQSETVSVSLSTPIKVDRGSNITVTNGTNVANATSRGNIAGFLVNPM